MKKRINQKLVLSYSLGIVTYLICYSLPKLFVDISKQYFPVIGLDNKIPFLPWTILIYIGAFFQWIYAILKGIKQETKIGYRISSAIIFGSLVGMLCFLLIPTGTYRPTFEVNNIFVWLMKVTFTIDSNSNACPSFHCFCSTIVILILLNCKDTDKRSIWFNSLYSILVYISTITTKQHNVVDVFGGILLAILAYIVSKYIRFDKQFDKLYQKFNKQ